MLAKGCKKLQTELYTNVLAKGCKKLQTELHTNVLAKGCKKLQTELHTNVLAKGCKKLQTELYTNVLAKGCKKLQTELHTDASASFRDENYRISLKSFTLFVHIKLNTAMVIANHRGNGNDFCEDKWIHLPLKNTFCCKIIKC